MTSSLVRKCLVLISGGTVTLVGVALLILPGPGLLTIVAGLAILASEFDWARRLLEPLRRRLRNMKTRSGTAHHDDKPRSSKP